MTKRIWLLAAGLLPLAPPALAQGSDLAKAAQNPVAAMISLPFQNDTLFGVGPDDDTAMVHMARRYTPGANLWYARTVLDRLVWDRLQELVDPDARGAWHRMERRAEQDFGQEFWWAPGASGPERAPDLGAIAGGRLMNTTNLIVKRLDELHEDQIRAFERLEKRWNRSRPGHRRERR